MDKIIKAIQEKKLISFSSSGEERIVEPYLVGIGTTGNRLLRSYQVSGQSSSGKIAGWKLFKVDEISDISILDEEFESRSEYSKTDKAIPDVKAFYD